MPPNDVVVASCDVNEAAAAEVAWSRGGPGSRTPGVFESRRCYFVGEDEKQNRHVGEWDLESRGLVLKNTWIIRKKERTASSGKQDSGDIKKTKGPRQAGNKTVEIQIADGTSKTRHRRTPNFKPPECRWPLCCSWMGVDGVVVSKVNFSNQHLGFLQEPGLPPST